MRLPILATALVLGAAAVPADAAIFPACSTRVVAAQSGATAYCRTESGALGLTRRVSAVFEVAVAGGVVDATLRCTHAISGTVSTTQRLVAPRVAAVRVTTRVPAGCVSTLVAVVEGSNAAGVSSFTPIVEPDPAR